MNYEFNPDNYDLKEKLLGVCFIKNSQSDNLTVVNSEKNNNPFIRGNVFYAQGFHEDGMDQSLTLLGLPVNIVQSDRGLTKTAFNGMMKKSGAYYNNVSPFPFIGMIFAYSTLAEIPGLDGRITLFPNDARLVDIVQTQPYESASIKAARRKATVEEVQIDGVLRRSPGLAGAFRSLLGLRG